MFNLCYFMKYVRKYLANCRESKNKNVQFNIAEVKILHR